MSRFVRLVACTAMGLLVLGGSRLGLIQWRHFAAYGHIAPLRLHADAIVQTASIGIPGVTKLYKAQLVNYGLIPMPVTRCDSVNDASARETQIGYGLQRWNRDSMQWKTVTEIDWDTFCKPYALGIVQGSVTTKWLWPGQSLESSDEATAARGAFEKGDAARFLVYARTGDTTLRGIPTGAFLIDEQPSENSIEFRVAH